MRLIEPLGLLDGPAARLAIKAGDALPLAGGPRAFSLARLVDPDGHTLIVRPDKIPALWRDSLDRLVARPPPWAGLALDRPAVMGILNVTPDSFSDGGRFGGPEDAVAAGRAMAAEGADIIDVGGESTRPGALPVPPDAEIARVVPVIRALASEGIRVSADTRNAATMDAALDAGAAIINDVSGLTHDPGAAALVAARGCPAVLMHMRGTPATMSSLAIYRDVATQVTLELAQRLRAASAAGMRPANIIVDPGFGFAKDAGQSVELLARLPLLLCLGTHLLAGLSRKSMIGHISGVSEAADRVIGSVTAAVIAADRGASVLRVHDVGATVRALRTWTALHR